MITPVKVLTFLSFVKIQMLKLRSFDCTDIFPSALTPTVLFCFVRLHEIPFMFMITLLGQEEIKEQIQRARYAHQYVSTG